MAIANEETAAAGEPQEDLLSMEYMDDELAQKLSRSGICTMEDLAEQSTDELEDATGIDADLAAKLIMKAREPWFAEAEAEAEAKAE
jgi:N utilization substance protein A